MVNINEPTAQDGLNKEEIALYNGLMSYRQSLGLPTIPLSKAMTTTAARHVVDIADNLGLPVPDVTPGENRAHSWSNASYNAKDPNTYGAIWNAPQRLGTGYAGYGFEILASGTGSVVRSTPELTATVLLDAWKMSTAHNAVMINQGTWASYTWNAVGIGVYKNSAAIWFGREADPTGAPAIDNFEPLRYLASNADLMNAFGTDEQAARTHYLQAGAREGRATDSFRPISYALGHSDLLAALGSDTKALTQHYISYGRFEGRDPAAFKPLSYLAGHTDLMDAFGADASAAEAHYLYSGRSEGRSTTAFNSDGYLASNPDLIAAFGSNREAAAQHYIKYGRFEGRRFDQFNAAAYEDTNPDLKQAFGDNFAAATRHYVDYGYHEGRRVAAATGAQHAPIDAFQTDAAAALPQHAAIDAFQSGTDDGVLYGITPYAAVAAEPAQLVITSGLDAYRATDPSNLMASSDAFAGLLGGSSSRDYASGLLAAF